jgi:hypothetical protein
MVTMALDAGSTWYSAADRATTGSVFWLVPPQPASVAVTINIPSSVPSALPFPLTTIRACLAFRLIPQALRRFVGSVIRRV